MSLASDKKHTEPAMPVGADDRIPYSPYMSMTAGHPGVQFFQSTLNGELQKGTITGVTDPAGLYTGKLTYAAINSFSFPESSSVFLPNTGCKCKGNALNVDNICIGNATESLPWQKKTPFQEQMMQNLFKHQPYAPLSMTDVELMVRAAPLPSRPQ